jgi:hypothetical protein
MVIAADSESWQRIFGIMTENSRWDLADQDVGLYLARSYDFIMDLLMRMEGSEAFQLDPSGDEALRMAKQVRRRVLRDGDKSLLQAEAEKQFGMPKTLLRFSGEVAQPLYTPARATSN